MIFKNALIVLVQQKLDIYIEQSRAEVCLPSD